MLDTQRAYTMTVDKARISQLLSRARDLLQRHLHGEEGLSAADQAESQETMAELWDKLNFLVPADVTKLLVRGILTRER